MAEELTYKRLRDLSREEKAQPNLVTLPSEFYSSVEQFIKSKYAELESNRSVLQMREFENAIATVKEISQMRQQKILFKAIRSGGEHGPTGEMTTEEHELYDRFCAVIQDEKTRLDSLVSRFGGQKAPQEAPKSEMAADRNLKKVKFVKDVPAYKGVNNETFGPFKPGDESVLPHTEADWLLKGKLAETVEQ